MATSNTCTVVEIAENSADYCSNRIVTAVVALIEVVAVTAVVRTVVVVIEATVVTLVNININRSNISSIVSSDCH